MNRVTWSLVVGFICLAGLAVWKPKGDSPAVRLKLVSNPQTEQREEVIFWHFWGGEDRDVVDQVVARFNESQDRYVVRAIAMPGNNLDVKLFLSITGGSPPDLVNQDDPIVADWSRRDALVPIREVATDEELEQLRTWLFPAARKLGEVENEMFAVCNGLDIRALYFNRTVLEHHGVAAPKTTADLDRIAFELSPSLVDQDTVTYLPDSRRLMAWGYVFGGEFYDWQERRATLDDPQVVAAMKWMMQYSKRYGAERVAAFRSGDQTLPGKVFPLLPVSDDSLQGRYTMIMDGQWRCRDIDAFIRDREERGVMAPEFGVLPLPYPATEAKASPSAQSNIGAGRQNAGWVNGNFFVIPKGAKTPQGAWEFMKFWIGFAGKEEQAAETCIAGGWIPVSSHVVQHPSFQDYLETHPRFAVFVALAESENQFPVPVVPGAAALNREVRNISERLMNQPELDAEVELDRANQELNKQMERAVEQ